MKLSVLFGNGMVLQRNKPIRLWGEGEGRVCAELDGEKHYTYASGGEWSLVLPARAAGGPYTLTLSDRLSTVTLEDVMVGEVWLASGQSNMEHSLFSATDGLEAAKSAENPNIRFFTVPRRVEPGFMGHRWHFESVKAEDTPWQKCTEETALHFSAVGYHFAKRLQEAENVAVGIISCNFGGSKIEAFIDERRIFANPKLAGVAEFCESTLAALDEEGYNKQLDEYLEKLDSECRKADAVAMLKEMGVYDFARCNPINWPEEPPVGPRWQSWPGVFYRNTVKRIIPYTVNGVLWYQGESNAGEWHQYFELFKTLVECWRAEWQDNLPFFTVQIAPFKHWNPEIWPRLVEQQLKAVRELDGVYLVSTTDVGEINNIHPSRKEPIGERLFNAVESVMFGKAREYSGPVAREVYRVGNRAVIRFDHANGLYADGELTELYITDREGAKFPAEYEIKGDTLTVWTDKTDRPAGVRLGFENYCEIALKNGDGMAAIPFRFWEI